MVDTKMRAGAVALVVAGLMAGGGDAGAQTGDPDRLHRQAALDHAAAIESAWASVAARIRVTDAGSPPGLWTSEWSGTTAPPPGQAGSWWLQEWTDRGLTARYCEGMLAVYAAQDELKGVGSDQRSVQVAPTVYGGNRPGLHLITQGSRLYGAGRGRESGSLPTCMPVPSTSADRVGLVLSVDDPMRTRAGMRWAHEDRVVPCPVASDTGTLTERRLMRVQVTAIENCGAADCGDLAVQSGGDLGWPSSCDVREQRLDATPPTLTDEEARCSEWYRWSNDCQVVYAAATPPDAIPDPVITFEDGGVYSWSRPCSCPSGMTGTCSLRYERDTEYRVFVLRPGETPVRTRIPHREHGDERFLGRFENCVAVDQDPDPEVEPDPEQEIQTLQVDEPEVIEVVQDPPEPISGSQACTAPWTSGTMSWTQQPGESMVYDWTGCCREVTSECWLDESSSSTSTVRVCGDGSRTTVHHCGASSNPVDQCDSSDPDGVAGCTPGGQDPGQGQGPGEGDR